MAKKSTKSEDLSLPATIAAGLRESILAGDLVSDERLPGEQELAERFGVSRPTIREALKRLAAQNLIRSRRGPTGGTFVNRMSWGEANDSLATLSMLAIGMQGADPAEVIEARLALLKSCLPFAVKRRGEDHLAKMRVEIDVQRGDGTTDEDFCASDVRFHRALADAAGNPMLSFQMAGVVEGMQPLLNLITYQARDREVMAAGAEEIADAIEARDPKAAEAALARIAAYVSGLATGLLTRRGRKMILTKVDDPRFLTVVVAALFSAALWIATWSVMGSMDMGAMDMSGDMKGMEEPAAKPMAMEGMKPEAPAKMDGMAAKSERGMAMGDMADKPMKMDGGMEMSGGMQMDMFGMSMDPTDWSARTIMETSAMWLLMMAAMMLPAMAPVMSVYAGISAKEDSGARLALRIALFTVSYFILWAGFSIAAAIIQMALRSSDMFTMGGTMATPLMAGVLALIAGAYQFTPIKDACLKHCRHPLHYLLQHWKPGLAGAFPVGARHGLYCFGCCVAFMGLMFIFGAMNIWWMAVIAAYFLAEKILPRAELWGRITGALLIVAGAYMIITNL